MSVLAVAPAAQPAPYEEQVAALVDVAALVARGLDLDRRRFVPAPSDPLFGYARCPVRGCLNVTEHTATSLCSRCQHRYGRWQHATGGSDLEHFLAEVTQTRSEDLERLCLVCRTPGHERPAAAQRLCYSCLAQAKGRGQSVAAYIAGDGACRPRHHGRRLGPAGWRATRWPAAATGSAASTCAAGGGPAVPPARRLTRGASGSASRCRGRATSTWAC